MTLLPIRARRKRERALRQHNKLIDRATAAFFQERAFYVGLARATFEQSRANEIITIGEELAVPGYRRERVRFAKAEKLEGQRVVRSVERVEFASVGLDDAAFWFLRAEASGPGGTLATGDLIAGEDSSSIVRGIHFPPGMLVIAV